MRLQLLLCWFHFSYSFNSIQKKFPTSSFRQSNARPLMAFEPTAVQEVLNTHFFDDSWIQSPVSFLSDALSGAEIIVADVAKGNSDGWFNNFVATFASTIKSIDHFYEGLGLENSFGWSIVTFTLIVKAFLFPLNYFQLLSSERMQQIIPIQKQIAQKYPNDKMTQQMTKVNPLAGCLPSFAQIPIFIGLYRSLTQLAAENAVNEPFLWVPNLEGPIFDKGRGIQWLTQGWHGFTPSLGWHDTIAYCSIPLFLVLSQTISMRMLTPPADPKDESAQRTQQVLKYLPLMIGWFSLQVPAALGVYWMTNNIVTTAVTQGIKTYLKSNPPELNIPTDLFDDPKAPPLPPAYEIAINEAKLNAKPSRFPRRAI